MQKVCGKVWRVAQSRKPFVNDDGTLPAFGRASLLRDHERG
jgi:hypothetical protein